MLDAIKQKGLTGTDTVIVSDAYGRSGLKVQPHEMVSKVAMRRLQW